MLLFRPAPFSGKATASSLYIWAKELHSPCPIPIPPSIGPTLFCTPDAFELPLFSFPTFFFLVLGQGCVLGGGPRHRFDHSLTKNNQPPTQPRPRTLHPGTEPLSPSDQAVL